MSARAEKEDPKKAAEDEEEEDGDAAAANPEVSLDFDLLRDENFPLSSFCLQ